MSQCPPFPTGSKFVKLNTSTGAVLFAMFLQNPLYILKTNSLFCMGFAQTLMMINGSNIQNVFPLIMCLVSKKTLPHSKSTSVHSWPVANRTVSVFFLLPKLSKCLSVLFVSVIMISFLCFSMGHKGSNHPKKAKPEMSERAQCLGQSHQGPQLNMWFEDDMEQAIREYHQLVFWCSTL